MAIEADLRAYLAAQTPLTALVATRITTQKRPQGDELPAITIVRAGGNQEHTLTAAAGAARPRFKVSAWAASSVGAHALADLIRRELDGFGPATMGSTKVYSIALENIEDELIETADEDDESTYATHHFYHAFHEETVPTF